ncbi:beta-propeller domain-containing protein [Thermosyntropha sp.]|uniref:beta-propeller domain-containing protein n=1 Tax=Thermosyntropha sp. TaxID=2740820 RepID=UPI0025DAF99A|nr:beta-propeller domain-containing protein [Thermosyntropha sp.]MBO8158868.1 beta-propeller domain-containing protein [Thermosyntropha sp.]
MIKNKSCIFTGLIILFVSLFLAGGAKIYASFTKDTDQNIEKDLPRVGSIVNLKSLLQDSIPDYSVQTTFERVKSATQSINEESSADFSSTNIQVAGVDESDIVKTDGKYIYKVNNDRVNIIKAFPADQMQLVSQIRFEKPGFNAQELYLEGNYLIVLGSGHYNPITPMPKAEIKIYPPPHSFTSAKAIIYNLKNPYKPEKIREIEIKGYMLSSRKIGKSVYLVCNRHIYWSRESEKIELPAYRDTNEKNDNSFKEIGCENIRYFPDNIYPSYIIVAGFNIDDTVNPADVNAYLGYSENIYASAQHLYIALTHEPVYHIMADTNQPNKIRESKTLVYKFALQNGKTNYEGKGEVKGRILNQFSMDEYQGTFRIATTSGDMWRNDEYTSKNNLYVLDKDLKILGKLEGIAPGERIYSTRFMGKRAYMVTFRNVDPLFVIDLKNPKEPKILGKLKIPGYSDYLHPYDENHIIGFGKDTIEIKGQAFYQGMKIALFDVTDVNNPVEISKVVIGDRGTESELLRNHRALLFSKDKNILAFPVTVMQIKQKDILPDRQIPAYGTFAFQGAYIYNIDLKNGFKLKGTITHLDKEDYQKAGEYWYKSDKNVERIIYIGDVLYTISPGMIKAHNINSLNTINTLKLQ